TVNFILPRVATPDISRPRGGIAQQLRLEQPILQQYVGYLSDLTHLDLNYSLSSYPNRVSDVIGAALPWTLALLGTTSTLAWVLGSLLGVALAWPSQARLAQFLFPPLMILSAAPYFITAMLLLYVLAFRLQLFPLAAATTWEPDPTCHRSS